MDSDKDGKVTRAEFSGPARVFQRLDRDNDGIVTKAEAENVQLRERAGEGRKPGDAGRVGTAPQVGEQAPAVKAKSLKDGSVVDLSSPDKLTVLVFGSHT